MHKSVKMDEEYFDIKKEASAECICRLCFTEREQYRLIFIDTYSSLDKWIENLTSLKIINIPGAPASLCLECQNTLQNFESFREMCFTNDRVFKEMFTQIDKTAVSRTNDVEIDHSESKDIIKVNSSIIPLEETAKMTTEYQDMRTAMNDTFSSLKKDNDEAKQQVEINHQNTQNTEISDTTLFDNCDSSPTKQMYENAEPSENHRPVERPDEKDHAMTDKENSMKQKRKVARKDFNIYKCELCCKKFNKRYQYYNHIHRHQVNKAHVCSYCDKSFVRTAELNVHVRTHTLERPYKCKNCDKTFKSSSHLSRHNKLYCKIHKTTLPSKKNTLHCEFCSRTFTIESRFEAHTQMHMKENSCGYCSQVFENLDELKVHVGIHKEHKHLKCNACRRTFSSTGRLMQHEQICSEERHQRNDIQPNSYKCKECEASFDTTSQLELHMKSHPGIKSYTCDVCQSNFANSGNLARHKRLTKRHTYTCDVCQLKFTLPEHLMRHIKQHSP